MPDRIVAESFIFVLRFVVVVELGLGYWLGLMFEFMCWRVRGDTCL